MMVGDEGSGHRCPGCMFCIEYDRIPRALPWAIEYALSGLFMVVLSNQPLTLSHLSPLSHFSPLTSIYLTGVHSFAYDLLKNNSDKPSRR